MASTGLAGPAVGSPERRTDAVAGVLAQLAISGLLQGALYALLAAGLTLIFGVMRVINMAHGELMILGAYVAFWLFDLAGFTPVLSLGFSFGLLFLIGAAIQRHLVSRVANAPEISSLLLTFGLSVLSQNLLLQLFTANYVAVPWISGSLEVGGVALPLARLVAAGFAVLVTGATYLFLQTTTWGKAVRATSQHPDVAMVCGIDVERVRMLTYGLGAGLAGAAGSLLVSTFSLNPESGQLFIVKGFACIVLGGMGNFPGALLGGLILGLAEIFGGFFLPTQLAEATAYALLLLALLVRPSGLLGGRP